MKKLLLSALVLCTALFLSCSKDSASPDDNSGNGGNNNGGDQIQTMAKRISEINWNSTTIRCESEDNGQTWTDWHITTNDGKQIWHWDNNHLLSIDYYIDNHGEDHDPGGSTICYQASKLEYSASKNVYYNNEGLVSKMDYTDINGNVLVSLEISYNNNRFSQIRLYDDDNNLDCIFNFIYSNNKIYKFTVSPNKNATMSKYNKHFLNNMLGVDSDDLFAKDGWSCTYIFAWNGNNLTSAQEYSPSLDNYKTYTYDDKKNPYYGENPIAILLYLSNSWFFGGDFEKWSQNNILSETSGNISGSTTGTANYTYNYIEDCPIEQQVTSETLSKDAPKWQKTVTESSYRYSYLIDL